MAANSAKFATQFAPYTPPPDDRLLAAAAAPAASSTLPSRPWFPVHASSYGIEASYQSGGVPIFDASVSGGGAGSAEEAQTNQWETRYGWRVDVLAAFAYLLGPISALALLVIETTNDYVRFHAYQSAFLLTPLLILRILASLFGFWSWLQTVLTLFIGFPALYLAFRAYRDAAQNNLVRFHIPQIGPIADSWVANE